MYKLNVGQCLHNLNGIICTESKAHGNFCCPFHNLENCSYYIPLTEKMINGWENNGCIRIEIEGV